MFRLADKHIVVTYHYVENPRSDRAGIHSCSVEEFERQIAFLKGQYRITTIDEVYRAAQEESAERLCALTFDDGLRGQFENAVPVLKKHCLPATFFVITGTFDGFLPGTHAVHILFSVVEAETLVQKYHFFLKRFYHNLIETNFIPRDTHINALRRHDDIIVGNLKERLASISAHVAERFFEWIFDDLKLNKEDFVEELFMNKNRIKELWMNKNFTVGNHSHLHRPLDTFFVKDIERDLNTSQTLLEKITGERPAHFCYPYNRVTESGNDIFRAFKEEGIAYAAAGGKRAVSPRDHRFVIPRYNCNDVRDFLCRTE